MNLEEFKKKYDWTESMSEEQMQKFTLFFMMLHVKMSIMRNGEGLKEFMEDLKDLSS